MTTAKKGGNKTAPAIPSFKEKNYCEDDHHDGNSLWDRIEARMEK